MQQLIFELSEQNGLPSGLKVTRIDKVMSHDIICMLAKSYKVIIKVRTICTHRERRGGSFKLIPHALGEHDEVPTGWEA